MCESGSLPSLTTGAGASLLQLCPTSNLLELISRFNNHQEVVVLASLTTLITQRNGTSVSVRRNLARLKCDTQCLTDIYPHENIVLNMGDIGNFIT